MTRRKDKSLIKNGMFVETQEGTFVKAGDRLVKIDIHNPSSFSELKQEDIVSIFKRDGKMLVEKDPESKQELIEDYGED